MNIFKKEKLIDSLDAMIDSAIGGNLIPEHFDESKLSALETKFARFLADTQTNALQIRSEKEQINSLISDISHQTKTPLANILLYTQLLDEQNLPEDSAVYIKALAGQVEKLDFLIGSLVKASRLESGILSLKPCVGQVNDLLQNAFAQMQSAAFAKDIRLIANPTNATAVFDPKWTLEALCNIVDNAIKYTPSGGSVNITAMPYQMFCRIDIADTGIGIAEDEYAKVFLRFYRSQNAADSEGVGIGLYLAREILRRENGYIKVRSVTNGTVFSLFLPIKN